MTTFPWRPVPGRLRRAVRSRAAAAVAGRATLLALCVALAGCDNPTDGPGAGVEDPWLSTQELARDAAVRLERVAYASEGRRIVGQVCRPARAGRFPIVVLNHGGWEGIGSEWGDLDGGCAVLGRLGLVVVMSSYRGEDGSAGEIEFCAGEATDVRRMLELVSTAEYADASRVVMYGGSHGGCVTVRALMQGIPVQRAASWNGPADLADLYAAAAERVGGGGPVTPPSFYVDLVNQLEQSFGGTPAERPALYAQRSVLSSAGALAGSGVALLLQHGEADDVVPVAQTCRLAAAIGGFTAFRVTTARAVTTTPPPGCAGVGLTWSAGPIPVGAWPGRRYLIVYEGQGHVAGANLELQLQHLFGFLQVL
jgi:dienelactone hydrolase